MYSRLPFRTTRGTGADVIIIDEAAHIDPALFFKTILPILQMKNTALLALSSPEGNDNYYSRLINLRDETTGEPFFRVKNCFMICEACRKLEKEEQIKCTHVKQTAHWLSSKKGARLRSLYSADPSTAIKEFGGIIDDSYNPCFAREDVELCFGLAPYNSRSSAPGLIVIACDPNGGGPSELALCSAYFAAEDASFVVSGPIVYSSAAPRTKSSTMAHTVAGA